MPYDLIDGKITWTEGFVDTKPSGRKRTGVWLRWYYDNGHFRADLSRDAMRLLGTADFTLLIDYNNRIVCFSPGGSCKVYKNGQTSGAAKMIRVFGIPEGYRIPGKKHKRGVAFKLDDMVKIEPYKKRVKIPIDSGNNPSSESV